MGVKYRCVFLVRAPFWTRARVRVEQVAQRLRVFAYVEKRSTGARRAGPYLCGSERALGSKRAGAGKCK